MCRRRSGGTNEMTLRSHKGSGEMLSGRFRPWDGNVRPLIGAGETLSVDRTGGALWIIRSSTRKAVALAAAVCAPAVAVVAIGARNAVVDSRSAAAGSTVVHAEKSGLRLGTR